MYIFCFKRQIKNRIAGRLSPTFMAVYDFYVIKIGFPSLFAGRKFSILCATLSVNQASLKMICHNRAVS